MSEQQPWYKDGLRFTCTQCGNCCTGPEGVVWVNEEEVRQIAEYLGKSVGEMRLEHTHLVSRRVSLKEFANAIARFLTAKNGVVKSTRTPAAMPHLALLEFQSEESGKLGGD